jgi:hypothetical protein
MPNAARIDLQVLLDGLHFILVGATPTNTSPAEIDFVMSLIDRAEAAMDAGEDVVQGSLDDVELYNALIDRMAPTLH